MRKGEIWWANLPPPIGRRPVLLLSRDTAYRVRTAITVAEITRTIRRIPVEVPLDAADGMPAPCVVNLDTLLTVPKALLDRRLATLRPGKLSEVHTAIRFALDLP